ncbi:DUF4352 domain-containing protein [Kitasatospora sp. MAP5-34]|uniref:DUF4352 domain-containing protein n=1 Tax=Kitasatospora sp. MAP5-34 TaxID=3035102 RepID=UPI002476D64F|nr:DUF4352 domain-containing protein [Kitasatospora sp. MAP5-34]MDH6576981.1 hypothetical protein [Kitasatospora sp. MAP5-34]
MAIATTARRRTAALLLGAALVALGATACGPTDSSVSTTPKSSAASAAGGKTSAAPAAKGAAKLGDTISLKGSDASDTADVTVLKVVDSPDGADEFTKPADGMRFVAVQFRIKDTSSKAYSDAPQNSAKLLDGQGQSYSTSLSDTKAGPSFQAPVNIAPGESALGFITFEVPKDAKIDKAQFALDSGFAQQTGQWVLA